MLFIYLMHASPKSSSELPLGWEREHASLFPRNMQPVAGNTDDEALSQLVAGAVMNEVGVLGCSQYGRGTARKRQLTEVALIRRLEGFCKKFKIGEKILYLTILKFS